MIEQILKKVNILKEFNDKDIKDIEKIAYIKTFPANSIIFNKNEIGKHFFIVKNGKIKIYNNLINKSKTIAIIERNNFFGEMSLLGCDNRSASAITLEKSELYVISKKNFEKYLLKKPQLTIKILYTLADRLKKADQEIESMLFNNILGRLSKIIVEMYQNENSEKIKTNQKQLAEYLGTTRVPICRAINTLKKANLIDYKKGFLILKDLNKLKSMAGQ